MAKDWIKKAIKKPGALRKELGVKKGEKIPAKILNEAAKKGGKIGQRARLAKTLRTFKADGGLTKVSGYKPVMGNNKFGYPSGGINVKTPK